MAEQKIKVLISDKLAQEGIDILKDTPGVEVTVKTDMDTEQLKQTLSQHDAIIIRSATRLTEDILAAAPNLKAIARAGVGVDNVDIKAASKNGTIVMNTPDGNTISTAELTVTMMLGLCRYIHPACQSLKEGAWDRKKYQGTEVNGKTIAIVGLGRIGCEVAKRCNGFNMKVLGYDPFISEERAHNLGIELFASVPEMIRQADFITVHTPLTNETRGIIGEREFELAKNGVRVINCARGGIIDEAALLQALESGKCAGAAVDVYQEEPPKDRKIVDHPHVLCTPHLGASTDEAQVTVAIDAARQIIAALRDGEVRFALNFPALSSKDEEALSPYARLARKMGSLAGQLVEGQIEEVRVTYGGEITGRDLRGVTLQFTMGLMKIFEEGVNPVSAPILARERGIDIQTSTTKKSSNFQSCIEVSVTSGGVTRELIGTIFGKHDPRITMIDGYHMEMTPDGTVLLVTNQDKPGIIASIGMAMAEADINIASMTLGRKEAGKLAMVALNLDVEQVDQKVLDKLLQVNDINSVKPVKL